MTTLVGKTEMDAALALLDLRYSYGGRNGYNTERWSSNAENKEGPTNVVTILSSLINPSATQCPVTSTPTKKVYLPRHWNEHPNTEKTNTKHVEKKIMCNKATQTESEYFLPTITKVDTNTQQMNDKIENLERKLEINQYELSSITSKFEQITDVSSDEYSEVKYRQRPYKRKRLLKTTTDISSIGDCESSFNKTRNDISNNEIKDRKEKKHILKPKNTNKLSSEMVSIGDGNASVPVRLYKHLDWSSYTNATRKLLTAVFSRKVLATHSLTGKPSPAFPDKPAKKKLDSALVNDIVQTVVEKCSVPESVVRTSITTKCADESKMFRTRQQNKKKRKSNKKENISPSDTEDSYISD